MFGKRGARRIIQRFVLNVVCVCKLLYYYPGVIFLEKCDVDEDSKEQSINSVRYLFNGSKGWREGGGECCCLTLGCPPIQTSGATTTNTRESIDSIYCFHFDPKRLINQAQADNTTLFRLAGIHSNQFKVHRK